MGPSGFTNDGPPSVLFGNFAFCNPVLWSENLIFVLPIPKIDPGPPPYFNTLTPALSGFKIIFPPTTLFSYPNIIPLFSATNLLLFSSLAVFWIFTV